MKKVQERLEAVKTGSAWDKGVKEIAKGLLDQYEGQGPITEKGMLNGADDWRQYCYGSCAMIQDREIAEALCTPSELRRTDYGRRQPNPCETWMDVQVRAHIQAWALIERCMQ